MKILLATYWPIPHLGGVTTYLNILMRCLEEAGHEVEILAQHPDLSHYYLCRSGQCVDKRPLLKQAEMTVKNYFEQAGIKATPWMIWREGEKYAFELACQQIRFLDYDLIHAQDILSTYVCRRAKPAAIPLVATIHGCLATEWIANNEIRTRSPHEWEYLRAEEYYGAMSPDALILPSRWLSDSLSSFQIKHPQTSLIPYGVDQTVYGTLLENSSSSSHLNGWVREEGQKIIACPARLVSIKGQTFLIEAMRMLAQERKDVVCWLIGDGVMRKELEKRIQELGLIEHVKMLGYQKDVLPLVAAADLVVLPSLQDNLPFAVIEAQSLGRPVIASRIGGIVEMIEDGVTGLLTEPRSPEDIYEKLKLLLEDEDLRKAQSVEARKHAAEVWSDTHMAQRTLEVYQQALCKKQSQSMELDFVTSLQQRYLEKGLVQSVQTPEVTTLQGTIIQASTRLPIPDGDIHLIDITGVVLRSTKSNREGKFTFQDVQPGNYEMAGFHAAAGMKSQKIAVQSIEPLEIEMMF
ncbi:group 1 glycosyl transferase [Paenibacillus sp. CAA11]|uniref:glycosyltransferase n=1 Tax=Paenibacillus sp. CAA11 TaxID=1532905 RepID=UPI000D3B760A|nr:glycosyltransferase [Paenibacillus sp. CAA11]AWB45825.1 group 1 glycosyl transferase [Paenibacillus sp. CAA11]